MQKHLLLCCAINFQIRFCFILRKINISLFFHSSSNALLVCFWSAVHINALHALATSIGLVMLRPHCNLNICLSYAIHDLLLYIYLFLLFLSSRYLNFQIKCAENVKYMLSLCFSYGWVPPPHLINKRHLSAEDCGSIVAISTPVS